MAGRQVIGAEQKQVFCSHISVPYQKEVSVLLNKLLKEQQ